MDIKELLKQRLTSTPSVWKSVYTQIARRHLYLTQVWCYDGTEFQH